MLTQSVCMLLSARPYRVLLKLFCKAHEAKEARQAVHLSPQLVPQPGQGVGRDLPSANAPCQEEPKLLCVHSVVYVGLHTQSHK